MAKTEPMYLKIFKALQQQITTGVLKPDEQLPTELQLAKTYDVSRITSKRALTELESQGLIYRQQGSGSFVQATQPAHTTTNQILFVLPFPADAGLGNYAAGISQAANRRDYQAVSMDPTSFSQLSIADIKANYVGVIYLAQNLYQDVDRLYQLKLNQIPLVLLDKQLPNLQLPVVTADNIDGGQLATNHLIKLGHQQILFYAQADQPALASSVYDRYFGYLQALHAANLTPITDLAHLAQLNQFSDNDWWTYLTEHQVTAIVVENDLVAIQLMNRLRTADPTKFAQLSIIGFDNIQAASLSYPTLTTVAQDFQGMGAKAVALLTQPTATPTNVTLPVKLIQRASTHARSKS